MEGAKVKYRDWVYAMYLASTNLKSVSSMKLHHDLGITQKTAWFLAHSVRRAWKADPEAAPFDGPVEVDETYFGGQEKNKHESKKLNGGCGPVGKAAVVGAKDQASDKVAAKAVETADKPTLQEFVQDSAKPGATVYRDGNPSYTGMPGMDHAAVNHTVGEYVRGQAHTNGIESFWAVLKRAHKGTFHKLSPKHLQRYVDEFAGRHNIRDLDTIEQMRTMARSMECGQLRYKDLIVVNGLDFGREDGRVAREESHHGDAAQRVAGPSVALPVLEREHEVQSVRMDGRTAMSRRRNGRSTSSATS